MGASAKFAARSMIFEKGRRAEKKTGRQRPNRDIYFRSFLRLFCLLFVVFVSFVVQSPAQDVEQLSGIIKNGTTEQKRDALFQIRNLRSAKASQIAIPALKDADEMVRATAASSVVFLARYEAVNHLLPLLVDKSEFVRKETAYSLGKVKDNIDAESLWKHYGSEKSLEVRSAIVITLGEIETARAVECLYLILKASKRDEEEFIRRAAAHSIGQIAEAARAGKGNIESLEKLGNDEKRKAIDFAQHVRAFSQASGLLREILQNDRADNDLRREAAYALGTIGALAAVPILTANTGSKDRYLAAACKEALDKIRSIKPL